MRFARARFGSLQQLARRTSSMAVPFTRLPLAKSTLQSALSQIELEDKPSAQRRSTTFPPATRGIWARVTPAWTEWPPRITRDEAIELGVDFEKGGEISVEDVLGRWDVTETEDGGDLGVGTSKHRQRLAPVLLGVSESAVRDALPQLDVGEVSVEDMENGESESRTALVDVLSGRKVLSGKDKSGKEYGPWSTRYCGHQFGQWAGQLGDGRAVSLIETYSPEAGRQEIQLKGAGRTPFSRAADGLAVLRSGVREYLASEAMAALKIPTTRALAILSGPVIVMRENGPEPPSVVARLAPSFIRIGHFEALNPGEAGRRTQMLFLGGGWRTEENDKDKDDPLQGHGNLEGLRDLTVWVKDEIMQMNGSVKDWFAEVVKRNAQTAAEWQVYGFMHGVLNTDNISILGLTIDYGPYAFMDVWDQNHICNHSDPTGLYSYKNQPNRVLFALDSLANALLPLLGYEAEHGALPAEGWSKGATADDVRKWEAAGLEAIKGWNDEYTKVLEARERKGWMRRFGLKTYQDSDDRDVVSDFLSTLRAHSVDFGASLRFISAFQPTRVAEEGYVKDFAKRFVAACTTHRMNDSISRAEEGISGWLKAYAARVDSDEERGAWGDNWEEERARAMRAANPRFVLRQWVLEEVIKQMETAMKEGNVKEARTVLARVLDLSVNPFEPYGEQPDGNVPDTLTGEDAERARLCSLGPDGMLGFQCSCSS